MSLRSYLQFLSVGCAPLQVCLVLYFVLSSMAYCNLSMPHLYELLLILLYNMFSGGGSGAVRYDMFSRAYFGVLKAFCLYFVPFALTGIIMILTYLDLFPSIS